jgi:ubiquinone/menaquinone biosynthesis C-methylase UbiE
MSAAYDTYDYPNYWIGRRYEHYSEEMAIKAFLERIDKIDNILDIGAGFGRLTPTYIYRAKKIILSDPSARLLKIARSTFPDKKVKLIHSNLENLPSKLKSRSIDLCFLIRVLHHIKNPEKAFMVISKLLKKNGYLILEFPNKKHLKATITQFLRGNFTFPLDIFPKDLTSENSKSCLPFNNYHPDIIKELLEKNGFKILETRSVSNVRSSFVKKIFATDTLLFLEKFLQKPLTQVNFGPSIFILAQKRG